MGSYFSNQYRCVCDDVIVVIFSFLPFEELHSKRLLLVSKQFMRILEDYETFEKLYLLQRRDLHDKFRENSEVDWRREFAKLHNYPPATVFSSVERSLFTSLYRENKFLVVNEIPGSIGHFAFVEFSGLDQQYISRNTFFKILFSSNHGLCPARFSFGICEMNSLHVWKDKYTYRERPLNSQFFQFEVKRSDRFQTGEIGMTSSLRVEGRDSKKEVTRERMHPPGNENFNFAEIKFLIQRNKALDRIEIVLSRKENRKSQHNTNPCGGEKEKLVLGVDFPLRKYRFRMFVKLYNSYDHCEIID